MAAAIALSAAALAAPPAAAQIVGEYALTRVVTDISEDTIIDWNDPDDVEPELEREFIMMIFDGGATDGASSALIGARPAELRIEVTQFDILSTLELFFCCAVNEVSAFYELVDDETGETIADRQLVKFDHIGRGGLIAAAAAGAGNDQIQRLIGIIRDETSDWIEDRQSEAAEVGAGG